jgi:hypothetical protein
MNADMIKILGRIQAMIARADHPNTPRAEADLCRQRVEEYMQKYRLAEEDLLAKDATAVEPVKVDIELCSLNVHTTMAINYRNLICYIADHAGVHVVTSYRPGAIWVSLVGYEGDVALTQLIHASARVAFGAKIDPQHDPELSDAENCYRMRSAGILRKDIAVKVFGENTPGTRAKVSALYKRRCTELGETPQLDGSFNATDFRQAYADGFLSEIWARLRRARDAANSVGGVIVLAGREERVLEALYRYFPNLRPSDAPAVVEEAPAKMRKRTKAEQRSFDRRFYSAAARAGQRIGAEVAREVELGGVDPAKRLESV